jgi:signal transduction histidine kinase/CheY-like chemotaxis protein
MELSREMLNSFTKFTPDDTAVYHVENGALKTLFLSENIPSLLCMTREEYLRITAKDAMDLTIPQDRAGLAAATLECIRSGKPFEYFYRVFHNTRGFDWVRVDAHTCGSLEGSPIILAQFSNMTQEGGIYQQILNTSDRQAMVFDRETKEVLYANEIAVKNSHISNHNILDQTCFRFLMGKDSPCDNCIMAEAENTEIVQEISFDGKSGTWQEINGRNISWCGHDAFLLYIKDVSALKNAEFEIAKAKQLYDDAAQSAKLVIWTYIPEEHRAVMMNSGYTGEICRKLHIPENIENVPDSMAKYVDKRDRDAFYGIYRAIDNGAPSAECEFRFQLPGQITAQYERMVFRRITDENGHFQSIHCCGQNISQEKRAQEEYEKIRRKFTNNLSDSVGNFELNLTRNRVIGGTSPYPDVQKMLQTDTADEHFTAVAGTIADEKIRSKFASLFNCAHLTELYKNNQKEIAIDYPVNASRGKVMWIHGTIHLLQNPGTDEIEGITYCTDITKEKREQEIISQLTKEECDYIGVINVIDSSYELYRGVWDEGEVEAGVPIDYDTVRNQDIRKYLTPDEGRILIESTNLPVLMKELEEGTQYTVFYNCLNRERSSYNRKKQIRFNWLNDRKEEIIAIQSDVTEAYRKEQEYIATLEKANRQAERANQAKSEFLSRMSHDIRTPLNGIMGMTYIAQKQKNPEQTSDCLEKIATSSQFLLGLVNDVLDMSKAESGNIDLHPEPYDPSKFFDYLDSVIMPLCRERNIHFVVDARPVKEVMPLMDPLRINQVFFNLLSNAVKFTPEGGTVTYKLREHLAEAGKLIMEADVSDTGIGMSPEFQKILFEPFTQERRTDIQSSQGTGLGLAIVKKLLDLMNCSITVNSRIGEGTTFSIKGKFDCVPSAPEERTEKNTETDKGGESFTNRHVLLCEDHPLNQEIAKLMLEDMGFTVKIAEDGRQGAEAFKNSANRFYDVILMDIRMPVLDGYGATQEIRQLTREDAKTVPIIAMTADAFADDVKKCIDAGMNAHLAKPIDPKKLYQVLHDYVK